MVMAEIYLVVDVNEWECMKGSQSTNKKVTKLQQVFIFSNTSLILVGKRTNKMLEHQEC